MGRMRQWLNRHQVAVTLTVIVGLAFLLRIESFIGFGYDGDDVPYAELAHSITIGRFLEANQQTTLIYPARIGLLFPAAVAFKLFGVSERSLGVYPLLVSLAGILIAYAAGRVFFNERVAILAATLHAFLPVDVRYGTLLYPDPPGALWLNVAILLIYAESQRGFPRRSRIMIGLLAGFSLGLSWLSKEALVYSLPFIAGWLLWTV